MLVDIYARTMLNATRHSDLPQRPLPEAYSTPPAAPGLLRRVWRRLTALRSPLVTPPKPCEPMPAPCK